MKFGRFQLTVLTGNETFHYNMPTEIVSVCTYIIHHEGGDGSADLIIGLGFSLRPQENEQESVQ